ncbi:MAG: hypothetical protein H7843_06280 [Nitrospirota bacterium]
MKDYKGIAGVLITFLIGGVVGAIINQHICTIRMEHMPPGGPKGGPGNMPEMVVKHIAKDLNLDQAQKENILFIMKTMNKKMNVIHRQLFPQIKMILEEADNTTLLILNADQKEKFIKIIERRNRHGFFREE